MSYSWLPAGRYVVDKHGRPVRQDTKSRAKPQVLQGWACHYGVEHTNYKNGLREIFLPGCFTGSLTGLLLLRDHVLSEKALADQDSGDIEVHDSEQGLAIRINVKDGMLDKFEGRDQFSVGYHVLESSVRSDSVRVIKKAVLIEASLVHVGAVRQTWCEVRDADDFGTLETDSTNWASEGASRGFIRELRKLQKSNDNHGPDGRFTSGGGGGGDHHHLPAAATVAIEAIVGAMKGYREGGAVGAAKGAAISAAISTFVESGGAKFVGEHIVALLGPAILPNWARAMLVDQHFAKSVYMDSFLASLSDEDSKRLCNEVLAKLTDDQLGQLGAALVENYQP